MGSGIFAKVLRLSWSDTAPSSSPSKPLLAPAPVPADIPTASPGLMRQPRAPLPQATVQNPVIPPTPAPKLQEDMLHFGDSPLALHAMPRTDLAPPKVNQGVPARTTEKTALASAQSTDLIGTTVTTDFDML